MTNKKLFRVLILAAFAAMIVIAPLQAAPARSRATRKR